MKLLDLPPEILQSIAEETVIALGPFKAQRLRLVNSMLVFCADQNSHPLNDPLEFLSHQILRATFATRIIDSHRTFKFAQMSTSMKARYLETRTFTDPRGINKFTTVIQRVVDLLLKEIEDQSDKLRLKYTRALCAAAADHLDSILDTEVLEQLKIRSISNDSVYENITDVCAAAAHVGNTLMLEKLIDKGVDIDAESQYFGRALRGAASGGHRDAVLLLLDRGADANVDSASILINLRTHMFHDHHTTALQAAALAGHEHIVRLLLEPKYNVSTSGNEYKRATLCAARGGHMCLVRFLMDNAKTPQPEQLQERILLEACCYGHEPIVKMMLDLGTNLNQNDTYSNWDGNVNSPLQIAACHNFHKIVQLLLASGADANEHEVAGHHTPLYYAAKGGHEQVAQTLLDHGADINAGSRTPLAFAAKRGNLQMVRFLLERGAALDTEEESGEAIFAAAAYRGNEPMVRLLGEFGASVGGTDERPNQAMQYAMAAGQDHVVKTLIELGSRKIDSFSII